jgi:type II secretory pathway pseudopilin PulG
MKTPRRRCAFLIAEAIMGLAIIVILTAVLSVALVRQNRASHKLSDSRAAERAAERTLTALQVRRPPPAPEEGSVIEIIPIQPAAGVGDLVWVQVRVTHRGRTATLVGLAPTTRPGGGSR